MLDERKRKATEKVVASLGSASMNLRIAEESLEILGQPGTEKLKEAVHRAASYWHLVAKLLAGSITSEVFEVEARKLE